MDTPRIIFGLITCTLVAGCVEQSSGVSRNLTGDLTCPNLSPAAQPYIQGTEEYPVRCGPQTQRPY